LIQKQIDSKSVIYQLPQFKLFTQLLEKNKNLHIKNIAGSFRAYIISYIVEHIGKPILYIADDSDSAERLQDDLELLLGKDKTSFLTATEFEPYDKQEKNAAQLSLKIEATQQYIETDIWASVSTMEGLLESFPIAEDFLDRQLWLRTGQTISFEKLTQSLMDIGLSRTEVVEQVGEFSIRGGIVDIFFWNNEDPVRVEFFGDEIDSMRYFDVITQRSTQSINEITILPNIQNTTQKVFIDEYLPDETLLFFEDFSMFQQKVASFFQSAQSVYDTRSGEETNEQMEKPEERYFSPQNIIHLKNKFRMLQSDLIENDTFKKLDFAVKPPPNFNGSVKKFLEFLRQNSKSNSLQNLEIKVSNKEQINRLKEIMDEEEISFLGRFSLGALHNGFTVEQTNLTILTDHEIFQRFKRRKAYKRFKSGSYLRQLSSLQLYDYVVHIDYGIGQYLGLHTVDYGNVRKECIKVGYRDGDELFVTIDRLNRVQKYSTDAGGSPKLTKLGGKEWDRQKLKTKESLKKIAAELIKIYAARKAQPGYTYSEDNPWQLELEASFPYEETLDQLTAIEAVKQDMQKNQPMDRLLCGDVGFGKTEVAIRAAFKAVMNGKQTALLAPTTILAFQHFNTFSARMKEFPVAVEMLNRFRSPKQQKEILEKLAGGKIDIVIGTHRLLSNDVQFKDLGLLIVDEEQRFGVRHKEKLKEYRLSVDILSMTATPIPRTLHMALMGARDLSNIDTPPANRLPVHTEIVHWDDDKLRYLMMREMKRGGQIYFVHNRVETIYAVKETISQLLPEAKIAIGHGQLPEKQLEKVMLDFMRHEYDILIASMIIENGLDIPNVNTIIINQANKFGLSQLYQLRGRVGRSQKQAYAFLIVPPIDKLTEISRKRLRAIQDFTDLGSGYKVALRDLEIRGAGNLLGKEQSGFVNSVGFELYCKILDEAVEELKSGIQIGEANVEEITASKKITEPKIDTDFDLLIPENYIRSESERMTIYHRLVHFKELNQLEKLEEELADRFGKLPMEVVYFMLAMEIKILASQMYAERLIFVKNKAKIFFNSIAENDDSFFKNIIPAFINTKSTQVRFLDKENLGVEFELKGDGKKEQLLFAKKMLRDISTFK
jgi:transcription-repair coupling factor (superfamily II helicase)